LRSFKQKKASDKTFIENEKISETRISAEKLHFEFLFDKGVDFKRRVISLSGDVGRSMYNKVNAAMSELESAGRGSITLRINSYGGSGYHGLAIVGRIKLSKCRIVTEGLGCIMSAATLILASGDFRRMSEHAWMMDHETGYEMDYDKHTTQKELVKNMEKGELEWAKWMAAYSKKSKKFWLDLKKDSYFTAAQCLKLGIIDEVF